MKKNRVRDKYGYYDPLIIRYEIISSKRKKYNKGRENTMKAVSPLRRELYKIKRDKQRVRKSN